ncbi:MAG: hypothetical protein JXB45_04285 [Candidatus Krumholzibacteriota bacterium]|nr:hypothetical protein [Candidatus Krumholzibacteriota bacterium]
MKTLYLLVVIACTLFPSSDSPPAGWQRQNSPTGDDLHDVFFLNDSLGWAYSYGTGVVIHTADGGDNWRVQARLDSLYFEQIQFVDETHGWLCGERGQVYKTLDGGESWIDASPDISGRITGSSSGSTQEKPDGWQVLFYALHFFTPEEGFVAGGKYRPAAKDGWKNMRHLFLTTRDGGDSWEQNEQAPDAFLYDIVFLDDSLGYASGSSRIFRTSDRGKSWSVVYSDTSSAGPQIRGLYFLNPQRGFAVTFNGKLIRTTTGGRGWEERKITENRLRSVLFIDEENGFIAGDRNRREGVLYRTKDGGESWLKVDGGYPDLHRISAGRNKLWVVGKEGTILKRDKY